MSFAGSLMKPTVSRLLAAAALATLTVVLSGATASRDAVLKPDKLVLVSTTDVKGKTSPCGCHIPKGGLSRRAAYLDSLRADYGQVMLVDNGGFFPEDGETHRDVAVFLMDMMKKLNVTAVNVGERDLVYGRAFLEQNVKQSRLPVVSANLLDKRSRRPVFPPAIVTQVGTVKVGIFGLITNKAELGKAGDSLVIDDPLATARRQVAELKRKGAQVIVLLSQLDKPDSEDLVSAVDGIDAVVVGRNPLPMLKGEMIKNTIACYGGEQGHYACRSILSLDANKHLATAEAEAVTLVAEVGERADIAATVKAFDDGFNEKLRQKEIEKVAKAKAEVTDESPSHFVGGHLCIRCHPKEGTQWKTTAHAVAWKTLVDTKSDAKAECLGCHVAGYQRPGGFTTAATTGFLADVQCESCHGMGTDHDRFSDAEHHPSAKMCVSCHDSKNDPHFNFETALLKVTHTNTSGETIQKKTVKGPTDKPPTMSGRRG